MQYSALFTPADEGGFVVTFRDVPEAITQGDTVEEAIEMAKDALVTAIEFYLEDNRCFPMPSKGEPGDVIIEMPLDFKKKVYATM